MASIKRTGYMAIAISMLLTSCGSVEMEQGDDPVITNNIEEEDDYDYESAQIYYCKNDELVEKYFIHNGRVVTETVSDEEIEKYQLDKLIDNRILIWQDCFTENELNQDIWNFEEGYIRNDEPQYYTVGNNNLSVSDGILTITAKNNVTEDGIEWTSASIQTKGNKQFSAGRIEARIRFTNTTGQWGAFWTVGAWLGNRWPKAGEIDICEQYGNTEADYYRLTSILHYEDSKGNHAKFPGVEAHSYNNQLNDQLYHIFAVEWVDKEIQIYIDDNMIASFDTSEGTYWKQFEQNNTRCNPFMLPQYLKLNLAIDPKVVPDLENPMMMEVDWVRVYSAQEVNDVMQVVPSKLGIDYAYKVVDADKITISDMNWSGNIGDEIYLGAVYLPKTVVDRTCKFTVDDEAVATIDSNTGKMVVRNEGTVTVTVCDMASGVTASRKIHISILK